MTLLTSATRGLNGVAGVSHRVGLAVRPAAE
jgi:hypothetical protein